MAFPFAVVCDLLEELHRLWRADRPKQQAKDVLRRWFAEHRGLVDELGTGGHALLSTLLPQRRTDRVYCIQANRLEVIVRRAQSLGPGRFEQLRRYRQPGLKLDLGDCVQEILSETWTNCRLSGVTVEEIDSLLDVIASHVRWSAPSLRSSKGGSNQAALGDLEGFYNRLSPLEAKWFTRLILKDYGPLEQDESWILWNFDARLPQILKARDDLCAATAALNEIKMAGLRPGVSSHASQLIKPALGTKIGRPLWRKGRSIKHCLDMACGRMSVEKKIDGEYCQIHIDLSKPRRRLHDCIQIFSKSGKDSTEDRTGLFGPILDSLDVGRPSCKLSKGCILEGELVVFSDVEQRIMPFYRIRNYVSRRGLQLGTDLDSPPRAHEHLMVVFYDVLMIDDESLLGVRHSERFNRLSQLVKLSRGRAELVNRQVIDFDSRHAASDLRNMFARTITARQEGLVLKPDDPYINLGNSKAFSGSPIKLKKEYVGNFGDVGDFAVVAARYDPQKAKSMRVDNVKWTHFFLGCLTNKASLSTTGPLPQFTLVTVVEVNEAQATAIMSFGNPGAVPWDKNGSMKITIPSGVTEGKAPTAVFTNPLIFDIRCFDFDKPGNVGFYTPRFPVVSKVHFDRNFRDTITFSELQEMAETAPSQESTKDSQDLKSWIAALETADPRGIAVDAESQESVSTIPPRTPRQSTQNTQQSSQFPESPCLNRELARVPTGGPVLGTMTPPPSSLPQASTPTNKCQTSDSRMTPSPSTESKRKTDRYSGDARDTPATKRRRRSLSTATASPQQQITGGNSQSQRQPLGEIPLNHLSFNSQATDSALSLYEIIDADEMEKARGVCQKRANTKTTPAAFISKDPAMVEESPEARSLCETPKAPSSESVAEQPTVANCVIAGPNCRLRHVHVMLTRRVIRDALDIDVLLSHHGIQVRHTDHDELSDEDDEPGSRLLCLVDSTSDEDREVVKKMGTERKARGTLTRFIEVYDWRILQAISDLEGVESVGCPKPPDPWLAWRVGLI